jgi:ribosomal protein S18 acetylase RimI-like enzyme
MKTQTIEKSDLLQTVMQGRLEFFQSCSASSPLPGAEFQEKSPGSYYYSSGIDYAPCNGVMESSNRVISKQEIQDAVHFFKHRKLPFIWWTGQNLEAEGFQPGGILTGIAVDITEGIPKTTGSQKIKIKVVETTDELNVFSNLSVSAFGMNAATMHQFQAMNMATMVQGEQLHLLAYLGDRAVGTATLSTCPSSAGIWSLTTLPDCRRQGVGSALVLAALSEAKKRLYDQVMAILMPKGMAWGLFTKLGFKEVCQFPFFVHGVSAAELEK